MAKSTRCSICEKRPVGQDAKTGGHADYCNACYTEGGWENTHSDAAHDEILAKVEADRTAEESAEIDGCWICFPELNEAQKEYKERNGSSRAGMKIHVTIRAAGVTKAEETAAQLDESYEVKVFKPTKRNGQVTKMTFASTVQSFLLSWDHRGRFLTGSVTEDGKTRKVRNVAEAIRLSR